VGNTPAQWLFSDWSAATHVACLLGIVGFWGAVALTVIHFKQYVTADEN
jgi:hypothetical protein